MLTASIVLFNTPTHMLQKAIESFSPRVDRHLFLIDNSPSEYDQNQIPQEIKHNITYLFLGENVGYGTAHNIALRKSIEYRAKYHIILNPDISFDPIDLTKIEKYMNYNLDTIYLLPNVIYPNGDIQHLCKLLPNPFHLFARRFLPQIGPIRRLDENFTLQSKFSYDSIINPPCLSGCFMFIRISSVVEHNLFFDEHFFMYFEDFDLIRRAHKYGKTIFYPSVTIIHNHARQAYTNLKMFIIFIQSLIKYFNKYGWFFDRERRSMNKQIINEIRMLGS